MNIARYRPFLVIRLTILALLAFGLAACSGESGSAEPATSDNPPPSGPLQGDASARVTTVIENTYVDDPVIDTEVETSLDGHRIERTRLLIEFTADTTVDEANDLLLEIDATITSSLAGVPSLVVRIPDPGDLQSLETLAAELESRPIIATVSLSTLPTPARIPANVEASIFDGRTDPENAEEWRYVGQHLAVKAHAAWNVSDAIQDRPAIVIGDFFGQGEPPEFVMDTTPLLGESYGMKDLPLPSKCTPARAENEKECDDLRDSREHGYWVLGIALGMHSADSELAPKDFISGIAIDGADLAVVDYYEESSLQFRNKTVQTLERIARERAGMIVLNLSLGRDCDAGGIALDPCNSLDSFSSFDSFRGEVRHWIAGFRTTGLENRVLIVSAASNRFIEGGSGFVDQHDAETGSIYNAASLLPSWPDSLGANPFEALTNTLVVENARHSGSPPAGALPFLVECTTASSFTGGHIAGIGAGGIYGADFRATNATYEDDGGTSSAAPQVAGLAAYMAALDPSLTPQRTIEIIRATAIPTPADTGQSNCTNVAGRHADTIDAYAAVLALDPPGAIAPASAWVRLALLDVAGPSGEPDFAFDHLDLELLFALVDPDSNDGDGTLDYGRYDLNGDGYTGGSYDARFNLDISDVTQPDVYANIVNEDMNAALGLELTLDESQVTDLQVLCYYAYTPLYTGDPDQRDALLRTKAQNCGNINQETITFASDRDGNMKIYSLRMRDGELTRLTSDTSTDSEPSWSPDGTEILFTRNLGDPVGYEIFVMNADGTNVRRLTNNAVNDRFATWSPDGTTIAYHGGGDTTVKLMDPDGSNQRTTGVWAALQRSSWSPDSSRLAISCTYQICIMDADGSNLRQLTSDVQYGMGYFEPAWSPDGQHIAFARVLDGDFELFVINADGSGMRQLTNDANSSARWPAWSPDSSQIAYVRIPYFAADYDIRVISVDGSSSGDLVIGAGNDIFPAWYGPR